MRIFQIRTLHPTRWLEWFLFFSIVLGVSFYAAHTLHRRSDDKTATQDDQTAMVMTTLIQNYIALYTPEYLEAPDVRTIVSGAYSGGFSPKQSGQAFWFDLEKHVVFVGARYEQFEAMPFAEHHHAGLQLEELIEGFLLLSTQGCPVSEAVHQIRNTRRLDDFQAAAIILTTHGLEAHGARFSPETALFIHDFGSYSAATAPLSSDQVLFSEGIEIVPTDALASKAAFLPEIIRLPVSITTIERRAFVSLPHRTRLVYDQIDSLYIEQGAFAPHHPHTQTLKSREGTLVLEHLDVQFRNHLATTRYYSAETDGQYLGHIERPSGSYFRYFDAENRLIGSADGTQFFSPDGEPVVSGPIYEALILLVSQFTMAPHQETTVEHSVSITLHGRDIAYANHLSHVQKIYRYTDDATIIEVKAYGRSGQLIAKGLGQFDRLIDLPDVPNQTPILPTRPQ